jgi:hypothetical protein
MIEKEARGLLYINVGPALIFAFCLRFGSTVKTKFNPTIDKKSRFPVSGKRQKARTGPY